MNPSIDEETLWRRSAKCGERSQAAIEVGRYLWASRWLTARLKIQLELSQGFDPYWHLSLREVDKGRQ